MTAAAPTLAEVLAALAVADARAGRRLVDAETEMRDRDRQGNVMSGDERDFYMRPVMPAEIVVRLDGEPLPFEVAR